MMNATLMTGSIRMVAVALLVMVAVAVSLGATTMDVKAEPQKANGSVADRTQSQRDLCETLGGGKLAVMDGPQGSGSNTTECKGGSNDGWTCYNTPKTTDCHDATPFQNVSGSRLGSDIVWQDVTGNEQPAPQGNNAAGNNQAPLTGEVLPLDPEPTATPVIAGPDVAADEPLVADPEPTSLPEDVVNDSVPEVVADEPVVADPGAADGAIEDGGIFVEHVVGDLGDLYFYDEEQ